MKYFDVKGGIALFNNKFSILLVRETGRRGKWGIPKGHKEDSDGSVYHTMKRELLEETNIDITKISYKFLFSMKYGNLHIRGIEALESVTPIITRHDEIAAYKWINFNDLCKVFNTQYYNYTIKALIEEFIRRKNFPERHRNFFKFKSARFVWMHNDKKDKGESPELKDKETKTGKEHDTLEKVTSELKNKDKEAKTDRKHDTLEKVTSEYVKNVQNYYNNGVKERDKKIKALEMENKIKQEKIELQEKILKEKYDKINELEQKLEKLEKIKQEKIELQEKILKEKYDEINELEQKLEKREKNNKNFPPVSWSVVASSK